MVSALVTEIQAAGFDVTQADALALLDRRHKQMCEEAHWYRQVRDLTVQAVIPNVSSVVLPSATVEAFSLQITDTDTGLMAIYRRTQESDAPAIMNGTLTLCGPGGVFVEVPPLFAGIITSTMVAIYPNVATGSIAALDGAFIPPTLTIDESADGTIRTPDSFANRLLSGVYADLLNRPNEARPDLAANQEALFSAGVQELRDRAQRRYRTKGPRQLRVAGMDA